MLVGSRPFPYFVTKKKSLLLSSSGDPVHLVSLGDLMHARQRSLWWFSNQVSFFGESRASCRSRSVMVQHGTMDVMSVWMLVGYMVTLFLSYSSEADDKEWGFD
jgi:metallophosphoesterase superfamily enzyme